MSTQKHFHHIRNHGRGKRDNYTVCMVSDDDNIYVGIAKCSRKDQFVKAKGRVIAEGRALKLRALEMHGDVLEDDGIRWGFMIDRESFDLTGPKFKKEVTAMAEDHIKELARSASRTHEWDNYLD